MLQLSRNHISPRGKKSYSGSDSDEIPKAT